MKVLENERREIKATHKKPTIYEFIDDTKKKCTHVCSKIEKVNNKKGDIDKLSDEINSRYNNLMIQCGGGPHLKQSNHIDMDERDLTKLSKSELIKLLLKREKKA